MAGKCGHVSYAPVKPDPHTVAAARRALLDDGYCVLSDQLPGDFLRQLRRWSGDWLRRVEHPTRWKYQGSDIFVSGVRKRSRRHPNVPADAIVDALIELPAATLAALEIDDLVSGGIYQIISKPAGAPPLYWHQDWARWDDPMSLSPWPQQVFLNWYLTDTQPTNGCLRVIPGSHRRRMDLHAHLVAPHEGGGYEVEETNEWMFADHPLARDVPVKAGQLVIGDARLLHGTHGNSSDERRTVLLGWYYRASNDVPDGWRGPVPQEILDRAGDLPFKWNREPGEFLR